MSTLKGACTSCYGRGQLTVRVNRGRRADVQCPRCSGTGQVERCARCGDDEPETHICKLVCGLLLPAECQLCEQEMDLPPGSFTPHEHGGRPYRVLCGAAVLGAVTLGNRWWARCEAHGGLDAADDARRAELLAERKETAALERFAAGAKCADCGQRTDAGPCPLCGKIVCQLCAEREGESCCPPAPAPELVPGVTAVDVIEAVRAKEAAELDATARDLFERAAPPAASPEPAAPPTPPITSNKRRRKKPPTSAPAIARRRRPPMAPELPGIPDHHDVPFCGCDRCWERDA